MQDSKLDKATKTKTVEHKSSKKQAKSQEPFCEWSFQGITR